ncbi:MAG: MFS transporter [Deferribacterales bacterium]|jgi:YNFM family putative membrane transporter
MDRLKLGIIIFTTILTFSALYAPQPIQPIIMEYFKVSQSQSALLTTLTMFPLSISPIFYGYILESVSAKKMLLISIIILAVSQFVFSVSNSFSLLLALRVVEGLAIPAILTGLMTYIATMTTKENVQKIMAIYISSTIIGGFSGRFFSGLISYYTNWRVMFTILGFSLLASVLMIGKLDNNKAEMTKLNMRAALEVLAQKRFLITYIMIFSMFFMFAAVLNFIPFRLREINPSSNAMLIGVMYTGYIMGIVTSLNSLKLIKIFRGEVNAIFVGLSVYLLSLGLFVSSNIYVMFVGMFIFCAGMFMSHTIASGYVNKMADSRKGVTNGLYVSFYYSGGTLGSVVPGMIYENYSWNTFLVLLAVIMLSTLLLGRMALRR